MKEMNPPAIAVSEKVSLGQLAARINASHRAAHKATLDSLERFRDCGADLVVVRNRLSSDGKWGGWQKENLEFNQTTASKYIRLYFNWDEVSGKLAPGANFGLNEVLKLISTDREPKPSEPEPDDGEDETMPLPMLTGYVTLSAWREMEEDQQLAILDGATGDKQFNAQGKNENIEWALWSWNPVTGCEHNCPYCYARDIANRFYPQKFEPSLWPDRLMAPANTPFPERQIREAIEEGTREGRVRAYGLKNVFTCSMADLFGRWVPMEWIDAVLDAVRRAPQWNFLFLTKFPQRMAEFEFPENAWVGTSVDQQARVKNAEKAFRKIKAGVKWLSCEPLIEPLVFEDIGAFDWIVLGGASASAGTPEWKPPREWVHGIELAAAVAGIRVYEKSNLGIERRLREYPGLDLDNEALAPEALRYLPEVK